MSVLYEGRWLLLSGMLVTLRVFVLSALLATALGVPLGLARQSHRPWLRRTALCWVEFFRGVSTAVLLFWLYFALPFFGISLSAELASILGLGLVHGAYGSEIVRGAVKAVSADQREPAVALGLSPWLTMRLVILPQAFLVMLPSVGNALVLLLKGTSIASIITLAELTAQSTLIVTRTFAVVPVFLVVMALYYVIALASLFCIRRLERRLGYWRHPTGAAS